MHKINPELHCCNSGTENQHGSMTQRSKSNPNQLPGPDRTHSARQLGCSETPVRSSVRLLAE